MPAALRLPGIASPTLFALVAIVAFAADTAAAEKERLSAVIQSRHSGPWSAAGTWEGGKVPAGNARVLIRTGHLVEYDVSSDHVIRSITISGTLRFATDKDTRLDVGLIKIEAGDQHSEDGFDCDVHLDAPPLGAVRPALEVGTPTRPSRRATPRLSASPTSTDLTSSPAPRSSAAAGGSICTERR